MTGAPFILTHRKSTQPGLALHAALAAAANILALEAGSEPQAYPESEPLP